MKTLTLLAAVLLLGCQAPTKPDLQAETADLQKTAEAYNASLAALNFDNNKTFYAQDGWIIPPGETTVRGYADVAAYVDTFKQAKNLAAIINSMDVGVSPSGGSGYSIAAVTLSFDDADGKRVTENFRDVHFWAKQADGTWKIAVDIWNAPPAAPTP